MTCYDVPTYLLDSNFSRIKPTLSAPLVALVAMAFFSSLPVCYDSRKCGSVDKVLGLQFGCSRF